jgi:hypothetical protein
MITCSILQSVSIPRTRKLGYLLGAVALGWAAQVANAQVVVPTDVKPTCTVPAVQFAGWFTSGSVSANGAVDPADSLTFSNIPNCDFYKWSEQMFLWLTSPAPTRYGGGARVFDSPIFYDVSPMDAGGQRTFIPNPPGRIRNFFPSIPQRGPNLERVVFDPQGRRLTLIRPERAPSGKPLLRDRSGAQIEVERLTVTPEGKAHLADRSGKSFDIEALRRGELDLRDHSGKVIDFSNARMVVNGFPFIVLSTTTAITFEEGQADGNSLMSQTNSLVYYALLSNDVFAYLRTGVADNAINATQFPTTPADLNQVTAFALAHSKTLPDANALAMELKTSWIEATGLPNLNQYVTITANVPTYNTSNPMLWTQNGTKQVQLALVGMHVVGSTAGHPEMLWASFEHVNNSANAQYTYTTASNTTKTVPQSTAGTWLFTQSGSSGAFNVARFGPDPMGGGNLIAIGGQTIGPSNVLRQNPWGSNNTSAGSTSPNTDVISINNSVMSQLAAGDVRKNYFMVGTTWTIGGATPTPNNQVGTNQMANATMETFQQPSNCFDCHTSNSFGVSHIFDVLKPLF